MNGLYNEYSKYLLNKYGEKVYKLPINIPVTCPNRDGTLGLGGCTYCAEVGAGFETLDNKLTVKEQLQKNMEYISKKYKAKKFIAYFQNYTNTYLELEKFKIYINQIVMDNIVEVAISTRPDCIGDEYLEILKQFGEENDIAVTIELGLQTVNYHTLKKINRGHTLAEFIDAVLRIKKYGFEICTHLILNLPYDNMDDVVETAKILSALKVDQVKLHSLYVIENTVMGTLLKKGELTLLSKDDYIQRVITFLEYLDKNIVVQRLIGRAPKENSLFVNWGISWWKIKEEIETSMLSQGTYQGKKAKKQNEKLVKKSII